MANKKTINNKNLENIDGQTKWEDLIVMKDKAVEDLIKGQNLTVALINQIRPILDQPENANIKEASVGLVQSYTDIADQIRNNMNFHMTLDENNNVIDYKKGDIDSNSDDMIEYIKLVGNYIHASDQIASLTSKGHLELLTLVRSNGINLDTNKEEEALLKEYNKGADEINNLIVESNKNMFKGVKSGKSKRKRK